MGFKMKGFSGFKNSPAKQGTVRNVGLTGGGVQDLKQPDNCPKKTKKLHGPEGVTCKFQRRGWRDGGKDKIGSHKTVRYL